MHHQGNGASVHAEAKSANCNHHFEQLIWIELPKPDQTVCQNQGSVEFVISGKYEVQGKFRKASWGLGVVGADHTAGVWSLCSWRTNDTVECSTAFPG